MIEIAAARRNADADARFDTGELLDVLTPDLRFRQISPGGYLELDSAASYVEATRAFLDGYD